MPVSHAFEAVGLQRDEQSWLAQSDDPYFTLRFGRIAPAYLLFSLSSPELILDPKVYFWTAAGFTEACALPLEGATDALWCVPIRGTGCMRVRIDPCSRPGPVAFAYRLVWLPMLLGLAAARLRRKAGRPLALPIARISQADIIDEPVASDVGQFVVHLRTLPKPKPAPREPWLSVVVPIYNGEPRFLSALVESVIGPGRGDVELILSDDNSGDPATLAWLEQQGGSTQVRVLRHDSNTGYGQAVNRGARAAFARWLTIIDHDDKLAPDALDWIRAAIEAHPQASFLYTDELIIDRKDNPVSLIAKPVFDPVLLSGVNYVNHLSIYETAQFNALGGMARGFNGAQDYDLVLRYTASLSEQAIVHIPYPAYCWRRGGETFSTRHAALCAASAREALAEHYGLAQAAMVGPALLPELHRVRFDQVITHWPGVSIIVTCDDDTDLTWLAELVQRTAYPELDVVISSGSERPVGFDDLQSLCDARHIVGVGGYERQLQAGLRAAKPGHALIVREPVRSIAPDWLREMVACLAYPQAGIVGPRLLRPDGSLLHPGVFLGFKGAAGSWYEYSDPSLGGPFGRLTVRQTFSAIASDCMLISAACRATLDPIGDTASDADLGIELCTRAAHASYRTVWTPFATMQQTTAGRSRTPSCRAALTRARTASAPSDPYNSPWYAHSRNEPALALTESVPASRSGTLITTTRSNKML